MSMYENEQAMQRLDTWLGTDEDGLDEQGQQAWEGCQESSIDPREQTDEQIAQQDCPLCPEWAEEKYKIGYDDFGEICRIDGVACCDTCYRVHHLTA